MPSGLRNSQRFSRATVTYCVFAGSVHARGAWMATVARRRARRRVEEGDEAPPFEPFVGGFEAFGTEVVGKPLRAYQLAAARAILTSISQGAGETFVVMMARQMGKNELSAQLEAWLLDQHAVSGGTIVKAAPTFRPQLHVSLARLGATLHHARYEGVVRRSHGYRIGVGEAEAVFLSASPHANVAGATASLLLEIDEGQDVDAAKYARDFRPMAAASNATTVIYGTAWTPDTILEVQRAVNDDRTRTDGVVRNYVFDWTTGAAHNPAYGRFVEAEIARMGEGHPLIRTQYLLLTLDGRGALFSPENLLLLRGTHPRQTVPTDAAGVTYIAGIDVAGGIEEAESGTSDVDRYREPRRDRTVVGIAEVVAADDGGHPRTRLIEAYQWIGRPLHEQCDRLVHLLRDVWRCRRVVIDASGLGADLAARLARAIGVTVVEPFTFTVGSKSRLAYHLLAHVASGRLHMWAEAGEARSPEAEAFWTEVSRARPVVRSGGQLGFAAPSGGGHDDHVAMLALVAWAARGVAPPPAQALVRTTALPSSRPRGRPESGRF